MELFTTPDEVARRIGVLVGVVDESLPRADAD
jgi:hypothetical protein